LLPNKRDRFGDRILLVGYEQPRRYVPCGPIESPWLGAPSRGGK
jgi:hypothetical protein